MFNRSKILKTITLWLGLLAASVQADDVSVKNKLGQTAKFRAIILSTGFDKTISVKPQETVNPIGTDLWHNILMGIYAYSPDSSIICAVLLTERQLPYVMRSFYLPQVFPMKSHKPCKYSNGFPLPCKCFDDVQPDDCDLFCENLSNAQVIIFNEVDDSAGHTEL